MALAVVAAVLLGLLLAGISYILVPDQKPLPMPVPSILNQIFGAVLWIALAALIAITIVGAMLLVNRVRNKKTEKQDEMYDGYSS